MVVRVACWSIRVRCVGSNQAYTDRTPLLSRWGNNPGERMCVLCIAMTLRHAIASQPQKYPGGFNRDSSAVSSTDSVTMIEGNTMVRL